METIKFVITYFSIPFVFLISGLYNYGYWSQFGIDIFPYLNLQDLLKSFVDSFFKFMSTAVTILVVVQIIMRSAVLNTNKRISKEKGIPEKEIDNSLNHFSDTQLLLCWLSTGISVTLSFLLTFYYQQTYFHDHILPYLWATTFSMGVSFSGLGNTIFEDSFDRFILINALIWISLVSYIVGRDKAYNVIQDKEYFYTTTKSLNITLNAKYVKYLGKAGDYDFFLNNDNKSWILIKSDKINTLNLYKVKK